MQRFFRFRSGWMMGLLLTSLMSACQPIQSTTAPANDQAATTITDTVTNTANATEAPLPEVIFVAKEYSFAGPERIPSGWTQITLDNQGQLSHDLILFKLDEGKTIDNVMTLLQSEQETEGPPAWIQLYGEVTARPGARNMFIAHLTPGHYGMLSFGESPDGPPDAAQGMMAALVVTDALNGATEAALPQTDASIELVDFSFVVNGLQSGEQLVRINNSGQEPHEVAIFRLKARAVFADVQTLLDAEMKGEAVSDEMVDALLADAGSAMLAPDQINYISLTLEPGTYVLLCFLGSEAHEGKPHHALGMVQQITVQ